MKIKNVFPNVLISLAAFSIPVSLGFAASNDDVGSTAKAELPSIVLVHGAWADGSCWAKVIPLLEKKGYRVTAVQNAMTSYADDVATTKRVIDAQPGSVVVVAHSYGGTVMTGAAAGNSKVKALVYVASFGPDVDESLGSLLAKFPPTELATSLVPDAAGFLYIDRVKFKGIFCAEVTDQDAAVMAATQRPILGAMFGQKFGAPAWKTIPSWVIVASNDGAIPPDLERFMAKRMNAKKIVEVASSHVVFWSHPKEVADLVVEAATAVTP